MNKWKDQLISLRPWLICIFFALALLLAVMNFDSVWGVVVNIFRLFTPLYYAIGIAFVLNLPMKGIERLLKKWIKEKNWLYKKIRTIALILTLIFALIVLIIIGSIIFPQILASLAMIINNITMYVNNLSKNFMQILEFFHINLEFDFNEAFDFNKYLNSDFLASLGWDWNSILKTITDAVSTFGQTILNNTMKFTGEMTSILANWFMGFMLSLYLLSGKEKFIRQLRKLVAVCFGYEGAKRIFAIGNKANTIFSSFISGQLVEACILGFLFYLGMNILNMPFAMLISSIIAVSSIVPMFGALFGMFFGCFLILAVNPLQVLWFIIFFQVLQQFEGNVIYPRVVGNSVGLPGIWVLLSIVIFGGLFGLLGMLIAVPMTALIYTLFCEFINNRLEKNQLAIEGNTVVEDFNNE